MRTIKTEPIRDINRLYDISDFLQSQNIRNYLMFWFGLYSGLRISDILNLRVRDVKNKEYIFLHEQKTGKEQKIKIHKELKHLIKEYVKDKQDYEFLFKSRKGHNQPITRQHAYRIINSSAKFFNLSNIGTHSLRKTFAYILYNQTHDIMTLKEILNHSNIEITKRYIGINQEKKDDLIYNMKLKTSPMKGDIYY